MILVNRHLTLEQACRLAITDGWLLELESIITRSQAKEPVYRVLLPLTWEANERKDL